MMKKIKNNMRFIRMKAVIIFILFLFIGRVNAIDLVNIDFNSDSRIDISDIRLMIADFGKTNNFDTRYDVNKDGKIDIIDVVLIGKNLNKNYEIHPSAPVPLTTNYFIGAYYMPKPKYPTHQWYELIRNEVDRVYPATRKPILGYYSGEDKEVMDWQIKWAVENGINYFIFDEYWTYSQNTPVYDTSLPAFLSSNYRNYMKFSVMLTSLSIPQNDFTKRKEKLRQIANYWKNNYFNQPNYLYINNKPMVVIYTSYELTGNYNFDVNEVKSALDDIEASIGTDIFWVMMYSTEDESLMLKIKDMGFEAYAPYYISPGLTHSLDMGDKTNGIDYAEYVNEATRVNNLLFDISIRNSMKFLPSITTNFDERPRYLTMSWMEKRSFSKNPTIAEYRRFLSNIKSKVDSIKNTNPVNLILVDGKPMISLGAYNEWSEDAQIEPGISLITQKDPFGIITLIPDVFAGKQGKITLPGKEYTLAAPEKNSWLFGSQPDLDYWYVDPNVADITIGPNQQFGYTYADANKFMIEGKVNIDLAKYSGIRIPFLVNCGGSPCTQSIIISWFGKDENKNPIKGDIGVGLASASCSGTNDNNWMYCDFKPSTAWKGRMEYMRIVYYPVDNMPYPANYNIGTITMI